MYVGYCCFVSHEHVTITTTTSCTAKDDEDVRKRTLDG
jgi:hypothetical protein